MYSLLSNKEAVTILAGKRSHHGVDVLQHALYSGCAQDIAKIVFDKSKGDAPSILNVLRALKDGRIRRKLGENFSVWEVPDYRNCDDPDLVEAFRRISLREAEKRFAQFHQLLEELETSGGEILTDPIFNAFRTARDKSVAHTEIVLTVDKYNPWDIGSLSLKWGDINVCVQRMRRPIELIGLVVRNSSFAWDGFQAQLEKHVCSVWGNVQAKA